MIVVTKKKKMTYMCKEYKAKRIDLDIQGI